MARNSLLDWALWYAERGWPVFPTIGVKETAAGLICACGDDFCSKPGKHPFPGSRGHKEATTDISQIKFWWGKSPNAPIGIRTGASGLAVLDVDPGKGGNESLTALGRLPQTPTVKTGGDGWHFYFQLPPGGIAGSIGFRPGLDLKAGGIPNDDTHDGYVLAPPSPHISGHNYIWQAGCRPDDLELAPFPEVLLAALGNRKPIRRAPGAPSEPIEYGSRNTTLASRIGHLWAAGLSEAEVLDDAIRVNARDGKPPVDERELRGIVYSITRKPRDGTKKRLDAGTPAAPADREPIDQKKVIPDMIQASTLKKEETRWLWKDRLASASLSLLVGPPGSAKTFIACDIMARVTNGGPWPDGSEADCERPGSAIFLTAEDHLERTVSWRLAAANADMSRIHILRGRCSEDLETGEKTALPFNLDAHLNILAEAISSVPDCRLVVIDPLTAYLGKIEDCSNVEVRSVLSPLAALLERLDVACLGISHFNKSMAMAAIYRTLGSTGFTAAARAVYAVVTDPDDRENEGRLFTPVKNNLARLGKGLRFKLAPCTEGSLCIEWRGEDDRDIDEILAPPTPQSKKSMEKLDDWLVGTLANGPVFHEKIIEDGKKAGYSIDQLNRAKRRLGIESMRIGVKWVWKLPEDQDGDERQQETPPTG